MTGILKTVSSAKLHTISPVITLASRLEGEYVAVNIIALSSSFCLLTLSGKLSGTKMVCRSITRPIRLAIVILLETDTPLVLEKSKAEKY